MSSTWVSASRVQILQGTAQRYYVLEDKACSSNCLPRKSEWFAWFCGTYAECVNRIIEAASDCEGGMIKDGRGNDMHPETYINRYRKAFRMASKCTDIIMARFDTCGLTPETFSRFAAGHSASECGVSMGLFNPQDVELFVRMTREKQTSIAGVGWITRSHVKSGRCDEPSMELSPPRSFKVLKNSPRDTSDSDFSGPHYFLQLPDGTQVKYGAFYYVWRELLGFVQEDAKSLKGAIEQIAQYRQLLKKQATVLPVGVFLELDAQQGEASGKLPPSIYVHDDKSLHNWSVSQAIVKGKYRLNFQTFDYSALMQSRDLFSIQADPLVVQF